MVPHRSTNLARRCLTSLSRREAVLSSWYGRSCKTNTYPPSHTTITMPMPTPMPPFSPLYLLFNPQNTNHHGPSLCLRFQLLGLVALYTLQRKASLCSTRTNLMTNVCAILYFCYCSCCPWTPILITFQCFTAF